MSREIPQVFAKGRVVSVTRTGEKQSARSEVSLWIKRPGAGLLPWRRAFYPGKRTNLGVELLVFVEPRRVEDLEHGERPGEYTADTNFDG